MSQFLGFDTSHRIDCQVKKSLDCCSVYRTLSCCQGLGCHNFREMLRYTLHNIILTVSGHPDVWISLVRLLISPDYSARVSKTYLVVMYLRLSESGAVSALRSGIVTRSLSHSPPLVGSLPSGPTFIVCLLLDPMVPHVNPAFRCSHGPRILERRFLYSF